MPEAPSDPATMLRNSQLWAVYCVKVWEDQVLTQTVGAADVDGLRAVVRGLVLTLLARRQAAPFVQVQCLNVLSQKWVDPSLSDPDVDTPARWSADWGGMLNVELRVTVGLGDRV